MTAKKIKKNQNLIDFKNVKLKSREIPKWNNNSFNKYTPKTLKYTLIKWN